MSEKKGDVEEDDDVWILGSEVMSYASLKGIPIRAMEDRLQCDLVMLTLQEKGIARSDHERILELERRVAELERLIKRE